MGNQEPYAGDLMRSTRIAYALVLRTKLEGLPSLKAELESVFERHQTRVVYQQSSIGYLRIVEETFPDRQEGSP